MSPSASEVAKSYIESEEEGYRRLLGEAKIKFNKLLDEARTGIGSSRVVLFSGFAVDKGFKNEAGVQYFQPVFKKGDSLIAAGGPNFCYHPKAERVFPDGEPMFVSINWGKWINYPMIGRFEVKGDSLSLFDNKGETASGFLNATMVNLILSEYSWDTASILKTKLSMVEAILTGLQRASGLNLQDEREKMVPGFPN